MTDRELFEKALEAMEEIADEVFSAYDNKLGEVILALRERLAQPEQMEQPEPDGLSWLKKDSNYFSQPKRKPWVGLTDDEIKEIIGSWGDTPIRGYTRKLFDQIEAKLKEKNT